MANPPVIVAPPVYDQPLVTAGNGITSSYWQKKFSEIFGWITAPLMPWVPAISVGGTPAGGAVVVFAEYRLRGAEVFVNAYISSVPAGAYIQVTCPRNLNPRRLYILSGYAMDSGASICTNVASDPATNTIFIRRYDGGAFAANGTHLFTGSYGI